MDARIDKNALNRRLIYAGNIRLHLYFKNNSIMDFRFDLLSPYNICIIEVTTGLHVKTENRISVFISGV